MRVKRNTRLGQMAALAPILHITKYSIFFSSELLEWSTNVVHKSIRRPPRLLKKRCWPSDLALHFEFGRGS